MCVFNHLFFNFILAHSLSYPTYLTLRSAYKNNNDICGNVDAEVPMPVEPETEKTDSEEEEAVYVEQNEYNQNHEIFRKQYEKHL